MTPKKKSTKKPSQVEENLNGEAELNQNELINQVSSDQDSSKLNDEELIEPNPETDEAETSDISSSGVFLDSNSDIASEALRTETIQPKYHEKPTVPRKAFFTDELNDELFKEIDNIYDSYDQTESANEDFVRDIKASLVNDTFVKEEPKVSENNLPSNKFETDIDGSKMVADIEQEIELAPNAENPFNSTSDDNPDNEFLSQLNEIFPEDYQNAAVTRPLDQFEELVNDDLSLSSESWQDVLESTKDLDHKIPATNLFLKSSEQKQEENPFYDNQWPIDNPINDSELESELSFDENEIIEDNEDESLSTLRRSFIEDFEQSPWSNDEQEPEEEEIGWVKRKIRSFKRWIASLSMAERVLLFISSIISLAVIVAITLVLIEWRGIASKDSAPPQSIELVDQNVVYPTGIQLPGGWFFFLQPGEIKNNKWDPQTAEWLQNTSVRRVVAIPWSRQAEAVIQSMQSGDDINLYMNNNDVVTYYVENTNQVDRDNVSILTDTEPSLAIILFKSDNSNRWVVIARP